MIKNTGIIISKSTSLSIDVREMMAVKVRSILIVDDEEDIREIVQLTLETMADWQVLTAPSGIEAISIAQSQQPDAILLDMMMPDLDGISTLMILRENPEMQDIPVILITAKKQTLDQVRLSQLDVKAIIAKPFDPMSLAQQIADKLGWDIKE